MAKESDEKQKRRAWIDMFIAVYIYERNFLINERKLSQKVHQYLCDVPLCCPTDGPVGPQLSTENLGLPTLEEMGIEYLMPHSSPSVAETIESVLYSFGHVEFLYGLEYDEEDIEWNYIPDIPVEDNEVDDAL